MERENPPYRADHVGSLLRSAPLKEARAKHERGEIGAGELKATEDREINTHGYFMEYDTKRAGGFEPLRYLPKGKIAVLGLITTKNGRLETKDDVKRQIEEATKFAGIDSLCLTPQCGFASTEEGNLLTEDEQWAKLAHVI
jgi:methionine synthase II (cobalamin-independent)